MGSDTNRAFQRVGRARVMVRTRAPAENKVSSKHSSAIFFEIDCITVPAKELLQIYTARGLNTT